MVSQLVFWSSHHLSLLRCPRSGPIWSWGSIFIKKFPFKTSLLKSSFIIMSCSSRSVGKHIVHRNPSSTLLLQTAPAAIISRLQLWPPHLDVVGPVGSAHCCRSRLEVAIGIQTVIVNAVSGCRRSLNPGTPLPPFAVLWPRDPLVVGPHLPPILVGDSSNLCPSLSFRCSSGRHWPPPPALLQSLWKT
jgi:hypothetical protein